MRTATSCLAVLAMFMIVTPAVRAQTSDDKEHAEVAKALPRAKVPLERALTATSKGATALSAKYEVEDGKLQLSVYTVKGDTFSEVIVDHKTGKIAKTEPITQGEDYTAAKTQRDAMAKARRSLAAAVSEATKGKAGYRAVSAVPAVKDGHPVADVTLVKGADWKTVSAKLD